MISSHNDEHSPGGQTTAPLIAFTETGDVALWFTTLAPMTSNGPGQADATVGQFAEAYAIAEHEGCAFPAEPAGVAIRSMAEHPADSQPINLTVLHALAACDACNGECSLPAMWPFTKGVS